MVGKRFALRKAKVKAVKRPATSKDSRKLKVLEVGRKVVAFGKESLSNRIPLAYIIAA